MGVPIPPTLAAKAIPRRRGTLRASLRLFWMTAMAIGKHHQGGGGVGNPHTQEGSGYHEAEDEKFFPGRAGVDHHQGDPTVGSALFHGFGQKKTAKQKEDERMSVLFPYHLGFENPEEREQRKRKKGGDGDGHGLEDPPEGRPQGDSEGDGRGSSHPNFQTDQPIRTESRGAAQSIKFWEPWVGFSLFWFS